MHNSSRETRSLVGPSLVTQTFSAVETMGHGASSNLEKSYLCQIKTSAVCASSSVVAVAAAAAAVARSVAGLGHVESAHEVVVAVVVVDTLAVGAATDDVAGAVAVVGPAVAGRVRVGVLDSVGAGSVSVLLGVVATVAR